MKVSRSIHSPAPVVRNSDIRCFSCGSPPEGGTPNPRGTAVHPGDRRGQSAFTMIEIALCLAIIGFALVAIIGVLPTGMGVQKSNREETIIDQDAVVWMDAIRHGAKGYDDLTNYVISITNYWWQYEVTATATNTLSGPDTNWYLFTDSDVTGPPLPRGSMNLTNGARIIGLLSTPKYTPHLGPLGVGIFTSNYVVAHIRAISGASVEKAPQKNTDVLDGAFSYRMIVENVPYVPLDATSIIRGTNGMNALELDAYYRQVRTVLNLQTCSHDLRLSFRWPLLPSGIGNSRQHFRMFTGGYLYPTNDFFAVGQPLYFFQPSTYVQAP